MQVTHVSDHVTHAVIGGGDTIEFGISSSAEFYNILSSTLYKDQILAVVREGLCNAWDAHIEAGTTHLPIQITIDDDSFIIKDSGKGIHRDDIGPIYGVYGNSTKKNDGKQTGGFGLGCKSPFAYTDHFEVISSNSGVRTIYNMSKSSAKAQGKPGIVPIASFPSEDSGLQVKIRIKNHTDRGRFINLVKRIAYNGDMNVTLNGEKLANFNFDANINNYTVFTGKCLLDTDHRVLVRYGNVVYPIDSSQEIGDQLTAVMKHLDMLSDSYARYSIIFQAPPHSIAVTPSRESLSMQEHTVTTLNTLFTGFMKSVNNQFSDLCKVQAKNFINTTVSKANGTALLLKHSERFLPGSSASFRPYTMNSIEDMAKRMMSFRYPGDLEFRKWDFKYRLQGMMKAGLLNRGLTQTYLSDLDDVKTVFNASHWRSPEGSKWLIRRVIAPLVLKMKEAKLNFHALSIYDPDDQAHSKQGARSSTLLVPAMQAKPQHHFCCLPYLRNIVVLSCSRMNFTDRLYNKHPVFQEMGNYPGFLFYHVGLKKVDKEAARAFFKDSGLLVVDIIDRQEYEPVPEARSVDTVVVKKEPKLGLPKLSSIRDTQYGGLNIRLWRQDDAPRILEPEFVIQLPINKGAPTDSFGRMDRKTSMIAWELFGDKGGIAPAENILKKFIAKGVPHFDDYMKEKVQDALTNRPAIQQYFAFSFERVVDAHAINNNSSQKNITEVIYNSPVLRKKFGLINEMTKEDTLYVRLFECLTRRHQHSMPAWMGAMEKHIATIPLDPINTSIQVQLKHNKLLSLFDFSEVDELLGSSKITKAEKDKIIDAILSIIN